MNIDSYTVSSTVVITHTWREFFMLWNKHLSVLQLIMYLFLENKHSNCFISGLQSKVHGTLSCDRPHTKSCMDNCFAK